MKANKTMKRQLIRLIIKRDEYSSDENCFDCIYTIAREVLEFFNESDTFVSRYEVEEMVSLELGKLIEKE